MNIGLFNKQWIPSPIPFDLRGLLPWEPIYLRSLPLWDNNDQILSGNGSFQTYFLNLAPWLLPHKGIGSSPIKGRVKRGRGLILPPTTGRVSRGTPSPKKTICYKYNFDILPTRLEFILKKESTRIKINSIQPVIRSFQVRNIGKNILIFKKTCKLHISSRLF